MSRAFVKEQDGEDAQTSLPDRTISDHPNYVTPRGLRDLEDRVSSLDREVHEARASDDLSVRSELATLERDLRYFRERLRTAIVVDPDKHHADRVQFGSTVDLEDDAGNAYSYQIVGEDEADVARGRISWVSPLAKALLGRGVDDEAQWPRPSGATTVVVVGIR